MKPRFAPGPNIAMKVPVHEYQQTVSFYRDVLGLEPIDHTPETGTIRFRFGDKTLWIDRVATVSQAEIWLEIVTDNIEEAADWLSDHGCARRDEIEPLPNGFSGFWVSAPGNIIHLVTTSDTPV